MAKMSRKVVKLDVRDDIRQGREPFGKIMMAVAALGANEDLLLVAPFEPLPLYGVLEARGLFHRTTPGENGDYSVLFTRDEASVASAALASSSASLSSSPRGKACGGPPVLDVDARGLEPPEPLVRILEAVAALPNSASLRARTDRRPVHLHAQLEERGFVGTTDEQSDGSFITLIRRR